MSANQSYFIVYICYSAFSKVSLLFPLDNCISCDCGAGSVNTLCDSMGVCQCNSSKYDRLDSWDSKCQVKSKQYFYIILFYNTHFHIIVRYQHLYANFIFLPSLSTALLASPVSQSSQLLWLAQVQFYILVAAIVSLSSICILVAIIHHRHLPTNWSCKWWY